MLNFMIPVLSGQPLSSGHLDIPRGWLLNTGLTVISLSNRNTIHISGYKKIEVILSQWLC